MPKKLALISAVSGLTLATALAQAPTRPETPSATQQAPKMDAKPDTGATGTTSATTPTTGTAGSAQFVSSQKPDQFLASKFKGTDVIGAENEKIGDVSDILFDKSGKIEAFVVSVGGFLGMGAKDVAMAPSAFQVEPGQNGAAPKLKVSMTKDQLKQAANFEPYKEPSRATTGAGGVGGGAPRPGGMGGATR